MPFQPEILFKQGYVFAVSTLFCRGGKQKNQQNTASVSEQ